jgi:putative thiamine transport system ATP-binding protein
VMGPSGSGKSSLLAWLAGLLEPPMAGQGRLLLGGVDVTGLPVEQRRVGLLFQDDLLFPHMSVLDNLLFALPAGASRAARVGEATAALAAAGLEGLAQRRPHQLSGGQRSRVSLLRTLLARPAAVLLDEPFSRLDAALRAQLRDFVWRSLRERGVPAVLVTHDEQDVPPGARCLRLADLGAGGA